MKKKRTYQTPKIQSSSSFETLALSCTGQGDGGGACNKSLDGQAASCGLCSGS